MIRSCLLLPILAAGPALAETGQSCSFSVACEAAGGCAPVEIETEIGLSEDGAMAFLSAGADPLPALSLSATGAVPLVYAVRGGQTGGSDLITIHADGTALRSHHPGAPGAPATTFFGTCEET